MSYNQTRVLLIVILLLMFVFAIVGCTTDELRKYSYLYCKVRDADPIVHQTVDSLVPVAGPVANVTVSAGCVLIETYATSPVVTSVKSSPETREELSP